MPVIDSGHQRLKSVLFTDQFIQFILEIFIFNRIFPLFPDFVSKNFHLAFQGFALPENMKKTIDDPKRQAALTVPVTFNKITKMVNGIFRQGFRKNSNESIKQFRSMRLNET